ncbi:hypothetical protein Xclt_17265 [Xanthomonas axonopodis pv. clitoriae]|uniref:Xylosidase n=1 Tax=Xanthomonas axonopodis pv. clitoriae TaxID=487828 RepID=A0AB73NLP3_9XANT|nr:hypothetical protein [Xanthomonas axonopodis]OOW79919.1 hypothetical protein Xclt_17265 [Xanthomonas axonopodis pv. clitoriae]
MNTHDETSGGMPIQPMSSGYYWFQDPYGSPVEIVDVDVEEGFVHFIARDSPLYLPWTKSPQPDERVAFGSYYGPLRFRAALTDDALSLFKFEQEAEPSRG